MSNSTTFEIQGSTALQPSYIDNSIDNWLGIHYRDISFNGRVMIGCRKAGRSEIYQVSANNIDILPDKIKKTKFYKRDYYITANTMSGVNRQSEGLFSLNNIVIDIDCHIENDYYITEALQEFKHRLYRDLINTDELPEPNSFVWTGRGLQLWWAIEPVSYKCKSYYLSIVNAFIYAIHKLLEEYPEGLGELNIDNSASTNAVGWYRFPSTYNTSARKYGNLEIKHSNTYNTHDLFKLFAVIENNRTNKAEHRKEVAAIYDFQNLYTLANERIRQMKKLQEIRYHWRKKVGRDLMIFIIYCSLISAGASDEEAMDRITEFNQGFKKPLAERTLRQYTNSARRKGGYPISNVWIMEKLELTEEEADQIGIQERQEPWKPIKERTPNFTRDLERKTKKEQRNAEILRLAGYGRTDKEIAEQVGCSINTVRTVSKGTVNKKEDRQQRIQELKVAGRTQKEVADIMKISIRTVKTYWNA